jgi:hypothetical protein
MRRFIFALIITLHGLIQFLGFLKAFRLSGIDQIFSTIPKTAGLFWLLACLLFVGAAIALILKKEWWWMVAGIGIVLSQVLIFMYWQETKFGTITNIIILVGCILAYGSWSFKGMVRNERQAFLSSVSQNSSTVTQKEIGKLPAVVQRWLNNARIVDKLTIRTAYFRQTGHMKTSPNGSWMPVEAEQYVRTAEPGFLWVADVRAAPFIHLAGRDKYMDGKGAMLIKLVSLFPVADSKGQKIDQGALLRYLAEMVWYPSAALEDYISWEQINSTSARATMSYGGVTASALFRINEQGQVKRIEAERYYDRKEGATLEMWLITIDADSYQEFEGIRVPTRAQVTWRLVEGDFTWYKLEMTDLAYNGRAD